MTTDNPPSAAAGARGEDRHGGEVVVRLEGIRKSFGQTEVLHGVDLTVHTGEHVVIFGPSGSGKSTLLRTINLLEEPSAGSVRVLGVEYGPAARGRERGKPTELRRQVGMVFQQFNLFPHLTALDNVTLAAAEREGNATRRGRGARRAESLREVGLLRFAGRYPAELSGGQQQRVAIARALSLDPKVMLFDEPTSALDPELVGEVLAVMRARRGVGDDDGDRHARAQLRPRDRRLQRLHGRGPDRRVGPARLLRQLRRTRARSSSWRRCSDAVATYDWGLAWDNRSAYLHGLATALEVAVVAIVLSVIVGLVLALARMKRPPVSWLAAFYVNVFRGVPALVSVLWVYFGLVDSSSASTSRCSRRA